MIHTTKWDTTLEFAVELKKDTVVNGTAGRYLWRARVRIIDHDAFPSNVYKDFIHRNMVEHIPKFGLFWEYVKLNYQNAQIRQRTKWIILLDQLHNLNMFVHLFVNVYLIDRILNPKFSSKDLFFMNTKKEALLLLVAVKFVPFVVLHYLDNYAAGNLGVSGVSRHTLQMALLRKFVNYDESSRRGLRNGDLMMGMTRDSTNVVKGGYGNLLKGIDQFGQLLFMLTYQLLAPIIFDRPHSSTSLAAIVILPIAMLCFLYAREQTTDHFLQEKDHREDVMVDHVDETVSHYRLIADYNKRPVFMAQFDVVIKAFNKADREAGTVVMNNTYFSKWLAILSTCGWTIVGGNEVFEGKLTLGMFLATLHIFRKMAASFGAVYELVLFMYMVAPDLQRVTTFMNMHTDVPTRKALNRQRRAHTGVLRQSLRKEKSEVLPLDRMPIMIQNVLFRYHSHARGHERITSINTCGTLKVDQGSLVCLIGDRGGGKSTLLKILGGEILPEPADLDRGVGARSSIFFVPAHLRVLHVTAPLFFYGTLRDNLSFGTFPGDPDADLHRVKEICELLGVAEDVVRHVDLEDCHNWSIVLSSTQCQLVSIARALIANPECLCMHRPTSGLDHKSGHQVMSLLKTFTRRKGLIQDPRQYPSRRPRTCIITTSQATDMAHASAVFHVSSIEGIRRVKNHQDLPVVGFQNATFDQVPTQESPWARATGA